MNNLDTLNARGVIEITATDQVTGAVRTVSDTNVVIDMTYHLANAYTWGNQFGMRVSPVKTVKNALNVRRFEPGTLYDSRLDLSVASAIGRHVEDWYIEETFRFNATGSSSDINTIYMGLSTSVTSSQISVLSLISLDSTFVQGPSELLSIKYRFIINTTNLSEYAAYHLCWKLRATQLGDGPGGSSDVTAIYMEPDVTERVLNLDAGDTAEDLVPVTATDISMVLNYTKTNDVGRIFSGIGMTGSIIGDELSVSGAYHRIQSLKSIVTPESHAMIPNYPMGPLFNHNKSAVGAFEEITALGTGLGYPIVSALNTDSYSMANFKVEGHRFRITKGGNSGIARFEFIIEPVSPAGVSTTGSIPRPHYTINWTDPGFRDSLVTMGLPSNAALKNPETHPLSDITFGYNSEWFIGTHYNNGNFALALINSLDQSKVVGFDSMTTPAIPPMLSGNVTQHNIRRNAAGDIYVLAATEYFIIRDPLGVSPYIESRLASVLAVTSDIRLAEFTGTMVQILTNDEFIYSLDDGLTWTRHALVGAALNGVRLSWITGDTNNPTHMLLAGTSLALSWYDASTGIFVKPFSNYSSQVDELVGRVDPVTGIYSICYKQESTASIFTSWLKFGESETYTGVYSPASRINTSSDQIGYAKEMKTRLGGKVTVFVGVTANAGVMFATPDGITCDAPAIYAGGLNSTTLVSYHTVNRFDSHYYDELDGVDPSHFSKLSILRTYSRYVNYFHPESHAGHESLQTSPLWTLDALYQKTYRWDVVASEWKRGWNANSPATADGTSSADALRFGFETDSNRFNAGSRLDISSAVNSATYNVNGMTICLTAQEETKNVGTIPADWSTVCTPSENPLGCLFEIVEVSTGKAFALMHCGYSNTVSLIDNTDIGAAVHSEVSLGATPATSLARYMVAVNAAGTSVDVYLNGVQYGSTVTLAVAFPMSATYEVNVGCRYFGLRRQQNYGSGFKGALTNLLIYSDSLDSAAAIADAAAPQGLANSSDLVVRYEMNADYQEGRVTSTSDITCLNDVSIRFPDGDLSANSYDEGDDYLSYKSRYGFIKDNATTVDYGYAYSLTFTSCDEITSQIDGTNVIPASDTVVTDVPIRFHGDYRPANKSHNNGYPAFTITTGLSAINQIPWDGDVEFTFVDQFPGKFGMPIYLADITGHTGNYTLPTSSQYAFKFDTTATGVTFNASGGAVQDVALTRTAGDIYKIIWNRTTDILQLSRWDGSAFVQIGTDVDTSTASYTGDIFIRIPIAAGSYWLWGKFVGTYSHPAGLMHIGDRDTATGGYSHSNKGMVWTTAALSAMRVYVDGVEQTIAHRASSSYGMDAADHALALGMINRSMEPPVGTVWLYGETCGVLLNSLEAGKTVTCVGAPLEDSGAVLDI